MKKIYAVVLLYNKKVEESITCKNISNMNMDNIEIVILDNSTKDYKNEKICKDKNYNYLNMNGNKGISIPYNKAIEYISAIKKPDSDDFIVWLDDDTEITKEYFEVLQMEAEDNKQIDIFAPIVYGQDGILYSPNNARFIKNELLKDESEIKYIKKFNAINSCLAVKFDVYKNYRYDEVLFLDQTDQNFFDDMRKLDKKFGVLKTTINQNFSQRGKKLEPKKMLVRYTIRTKDIMRYGRKSLLNTCKSFIKASGLALQMGIKCKYPKITLKCTGIALVMFFGNIKNILLRKVK